MGLAGREGRIPATRAVLAAALGLRLTALSAAPPHPITPGPAAADALALEQAGRLIEAAAAYEQIAATNPAAHLALAHHLVRLYARAAATNAALRWAGQVMKTNPDPQAYLAGVHSLLGNHAKARAILERELKAPGPDRRRMTLLWQLADALAALGDRPGAEASLRRAEALAQGTPDQAVAERRLSEFVKGGGELQGSPAAQGGNAPPKPAARE